MNEGYNDVRWDDKLMATNFILTPHFLHIQMQEKLDLEVIKDLVSKMLDHPDFVRGMNVLWDGRDVPDVDLTYADMQAFGKFLAPHRERRGSGRSAFLAPADLLYGVFRTHEMMNQKNFDYHFRVFREYGEAIAWVEGGGEADSS